MRQGQQSRRGRGRGRKPQNPLARNYESNGPDVKIRGTASHIAEKYMSLARDAIASGDMVTAESYLQHAEHYNRIIMAAQSQQMGSQPGQHQSDGPNGGGGYRQQRYNPESANAEAANADSANEERAEPDAKVRGARGGDRRRGGNGREGAAESNGSDRPAARQPDDSASDPVS